MKTDQGAPSTAVQGAGAKGLTSGRQLFPVGELVRRNPHLLTEGRARAYIFAAEPRLGVKGIIPGNGLAFAIVRIGRRVLVDEEGFYEWLNSHRMVDEASDSLKAHARGR